MKSRLVASVSPLLSSGTCRRNSNIVSSRMLAAFSESLDRRIKSSFQYQRFESSSKAVHSSALEDDDFSELGPEKTECSGRQIRLVTEKPDRFVNTDRYKRKLAGRPISADTTPNMKDITTKIDRYSPNSDFKLGGHTHTSILNDDTEKNSDLENPCSVYVKNIPPTADLSELVEAISIFGKVSGASFANASNGLRCCQIDFQSADSWKRAISAGKIAVGRQLLPVCRLDAVDVVAVRIKNINSTTTDFSIHSRCKSVGEFVGLTRTSKDVVDAYYNVGNETMLQRIIKKLNGTVIDGSRWFADTLTCKSAPSEVSPETEAKSKLGMQICDHLSELKSELVMKKIYLEDLECLHASIMHIEHLPSHSRY